MRYLLGLLILASLSAQALTKEEMQAAMQGEDLNKALKKRHKKVEAAQCSTNGDCEVDEVCYKASKYETEGVCVRRPKD